MHRKCLNITVTRGEETCVTVQRWEEVLSVVGGGGSVEGLRSLGAVFEDRCVYPVCAGEGTTLPSTLVKDSCAFIAPDQMGSQAKLAYLIDTEFFFSFVSFCPNWPQTCNLFALASHTMPGLAVTLLWNFDTCILMLSYCFLYKSLASMILEMAVLSYLWLWHYTSQSIAFDAEM